MSRSPARRQRRRPAGPDRGETLIELLVTTVVVGLGVTAVLGAVGVAVRVSALQRQQAQAQELVTSWAERVADVVDTTAAPGPDGAPPRRYVECASPAAAYAAPPPPPAPDAGWTTVARIWDGTGWAAALPVDCVDTGVQTVLLTATAPGRGAYEGASAALVVTVRRPCAAVGAC